MGKGKKPDFPKPKKSQRHGGKGTNGAVSVKQKGGAGAKPQHRKAKVKGKTCSSCGGTVAAGSESRHEIYDPKTGKVSHPCTDQRWREVLVLPPVASMVVTAMVDEEPPAPTTTAPSSTVVVCERCKKSVAPGEGSHFRLKQRVNARPGVMDKKWHCHAPPPPKVVAPPPPPKPKPVVASAKVGKWFKVGELWDCSSCHKIDISATYAYCPGGSCGGIRPPF